MSAVPVRRALPKGVKLSGSSISLSGDMVNGIPSSRDKCDLFLEMSTFSISPGLFL